MSTQIPWNASYANLPERFYQRLGPGRFREPHLLYWNKELAQQLGIPEMEDSERAKVFSGSEVLYNQKPLAQAYSGHQFGYFNPNLGDGRAMLLGELSNRDGVLQDVHLKGSGPTAYSRRGDGLANYTACIKEVLVSENMHALGVPSCRSLAIVGTGEQVLRQTPEPGAVLARVARHHIRVGTFEYFSSRKDFEAVRTLMDYLIRRDFPDIQNRDEESYLKLLKRIVQKQAHLIAKWTELGFVHGVMNTDNCFLSGETLDFGPCAFMEAYDPTVVFSSIDQDGRYAFDKQPTIAQWNLSKFALSIRSLFSGTSEEVTKKLTQVLEGFGPLFEKYQLQNIGRKFGLENATGDDLPLMQDFLKRMYFAKKDYTQGFSGLADLLHPETCLEVDVFYLDGDGPNWVNTWRDRLRSEGDVSNVANKMRMVNPQIVARNEFIEKATTLALGGDWSYFNDLLRTLQSPFTKLESTRSEFYSPPKTGSNAFVTFCNT